METLLAGLGMVDDSGSDTGDDDSGSDTGDDGPGSDTGDDDSGKYAGAPFLLNLRHLVHEQLQPYFQTSLEKRGMLRIPIRIRLGSSYAGDSSSALSDTSFSCGLCIKPNGLFTFDGLTDDVPSGASLYTNSLYNCVLNSVSDPSYPLLRNIVINAAIYHDTRVSGIASINTDNDPNKILAEIDASVLPSFSGSPTLVQYILNHDGYREEEQISSFPAPDSTLMQWDGSSYSILSVPSDGISNIIQSDDDQLALHAQRRLKDFAKAKRRQSWVLHGVQPSFVAGMFIDFANINSNGDIYQYLVNAAIVSAEMDFVEQKTRLEMFE
jgi:hypothetical protein